jgi:hypothetical protein
MRFADGHMLKIKGAWYIGLHKTKDAISQEKNVIRLILDDSIDDAKGFMEPSDARNLEKFQRAVINGMRNYANEMQAKADAIRADLEKEDFSSFDNPEHEMKKKYAQVVGSTIKDPLEKTILFRIFDGSDPHDDVENLVSKSLGAQSKVDRIRDLIGGVRWMDFYSDTVQ